MPQGWTNFYNSRVSNFVVDPASLLWDSGHQINWAVLDDRYQEDAVTIKLSAAVSANDVSIAVDALPVKIPKGISLNFGLWDGLAKAFVVTTAEAAAGATSIAVEAVPTALQDNDEAYWSPSRPGKILRAGTIMTLEGGYMIPRARATVKTSDALSIDNVAPIVFTEVAHGFVTGEFLRVSDSVTNTGANGVWRITKLTDDTFALLGSQGNGATSAVTTARRAARGILGSDARENDRSAAMSGRGLIVGGHIYRNLLPEYDSASATWLNYEEELLFPGAGTRFSFETYALTIS